MINFTEFVIFTIFVLSNEIKNPMGSIKKSHSSKKKK